MEIHCGYDELVPLKQVKPNPANRNIHPQEQIKRLAEILEYQGFRHPLIVSKNTGILVVGHGRLAAAKMLGLKEVPVKYQEFKDSDQEYAFAVSDNAIAAWAELDFSGINLDIGDLGPDFNMDMLGLKNFTVDPFEKEEPEASVETFNEKMITCPECEHTFVMPKGRNNG